MNRLLAPILLMLSLLVGEARADVAALTAPANLHVERKRDDAVSITWTPLALPSVTYTVEVSADDGATWRIAGTSSSYYLGVGNLSPSVSYRWRISSSIVAVSKPSATLTFSTKLATTAATTAPIVVKPSTLPATAPTTRAVAATHQTIELAIVDGTGTPALHKPYLDACGFVGVREWVGINWRTGRVNDMASIARCNAWAAAGYTVVATATPDEVGTPAKPGRVGTMCPDYSVAALDLIQLDPRVILQVGNELNLPNYGIGGSFAAGCRTFSFPILRKLRALDPSRQLASASISWQAPSFLAQQWAPLIAEATGLVDYVDVHDYTLDVRNFDDVLAAGGGVAAQLNAKLMCSEWGGFRGTGPAYGEPLAAVLAQERASLRNRADVSAYFVAQNVAKFGDAYAWLWDLNGGKTTATYNAFVASPPVAATQPVSLLDQLRAGSVVFDSHVRGVAGTLRAYSEDEFWQNARDDADYANGIRNNPVPLWIFDDERTSLDTAEGRATVNARDAHYADLVHATAPGMLFGVYGLVGSDYWPYVNADSSLWQPARDQIAARDLLLLPTLAHCDVLIGGIYPYYAESGAQSDGPTELKVVRDKQYVAATIARLEKLSALLGGKPIVLMARAVDHETNAPLSTTRADALVDDTAGCNLVLWGDSHDEAGIGVRMLQRALAARAAVTR